MQIVIQYYLLVKILDVDKSIILIHETKPMMSDVNIIWTINSFDFRLFGEELHRSREEHQQYCSPLAAS